MRSLATGPSRIVAIKCPEPLRQQLIDSLADGEDISSLTRQLWAKEIAARERKSARKKLSKK